MKNFIASATLLLAAFATANGNQSGSFGYFVNNVDNVRQLDILYLPEYSSIYILQKSLNIGDIIKNYLALKNALADDNGNDAAKAGISLLQSLKDVYKNSLKEDQKKKFEDIADDASENAEHISKNSKNIAHQREHFDQLSKDIYDLVKNFGSVKTLFKIFCSTNNNGKGAFWLNETKEIKNPYLGKTMSNCGTVTEELKP